MLQVEKFNEIIKASWERGYCWDDKRKVGRVKAGNLGWITYSQARGDDNAVIIEFNRLPNIKALAECAAEALDAINEVLANTGL